MADEKKDKRDHGEGSVSQRKDGSWTARIMIGHLANGNPKIKAFYGKTENEVKKKLRDYKKNIEAFSSENVAKMSLSVYMQNWLEVYKRPNLKPTSYDRLDDNKRLHVDSSLGYMHVKNITADDIQKHLTNLSERGYGYSTVKKVYMLLNACFNHAIANGDLQRNPMAPIESPKQKEYKRKEVNILTDSEIMRFTDEAYKKFEYSTDIYVHRLGAVYILMLNTGIRVGELIALKWSDYNEREKTIQVSGNVVTVKNRDKKTPDDPSYVQVFQSAKTISSQGRKIPLNKAAMLAIQNLKTVNTGNP